MCLDVLPLDVPLERHLVRQDLAAVRTQLLLVDLVDLVDVVSEVVPVPEDIKYTLNTQTRTYY